MKAARGHLGAQVEWVRRRRAAEAAGHDPDAADQTVLERIQAAREAGRPELI